MKKSLATFVISLLVVTSLSITSTHANDDFEALLNALNEDISTSEIVEGTPIKKENTHSLEDWEMELDFMKEKESSVKTTSNTIPPFENKNNTYSSEANIQPFVETTSSNLEFEPENFNGIEFEPEVITDAPALDSVEPIDNSAIYTAPRTDGQQLTATGTAEAFYIILFLMLTWGIIFLRRMKK